MADYVITGIGKTDGATIINESTASTVLNIGTSGTTTATWQTAAAVFANQRGMRFSVGTNSFVFAQISDNPIDGDPNGSYAVGAFIKTPASAPTESKTILSVRINSGGSTGSSVLLGSNWKIRAHNRTGSAMGTAFTTSLSPNTTYWVSYRATKGTTGTAPASTDGELQVGYYLPNTTTPIESYVIPNVDTGLTDATMGRAGLIGATASAYSLDFSNVVVRSGGTGLILPPTNTSPPSVTIDPAQTGVEPWATVTHTAAGSDAQGTVTYAWTVDSTSPAGLLTTANLTGATSTNVTYEAPATLSGATVTLRCTVTDTDSETATSTVTDTILFATDRWIDHGGVQRPMRRESVE